MFVVGVFILHGDDVCPNCQEKDNSEIFNLKSFLLENQVSSLESLSNQTGISVTNLNRHIQKEDFIQVRKELKHNTAL